MSIAISDVPSSSTPVAPKSGWRIASLDQFRGYTVAGMFLVNFLGSYGVTAAILKHHNTYCSYADTIMPHFFFAVGFSFRLAFGRRVQTQGARAAYTHVIQRAFDLALVAIIFYGCHEGWSSIQELAKRTCFQTLMHIAVTTLWILPVIRAGTAVRVLYLLLSAVAHVFLSHWFYFDWVHASPQAIDGGPLGFLTWSIPTLVGTFCCDAVVATQGRPSVGKMLFWAVALMAIGYGLSCYTTFYDTSRTRTAGELAHGALAKDPVLPSSERHGEAYIPPQLAEPPFVAPPPAEKRHENYWMMSQRAGSISYLTFAAGLSVAVYLFFHLLSDRMGVVIGVFRTLGSNALAAYILGSYMQRAFRGSVAKIMMSLPASILEEHGWKSTSAIIKESPAFYAAADFALYFLCVYLIIRYLEARKIFIRL